MASDSSRPAGAHSQANKVGACHVLAALSLLGQSVLTVETERNLCARSISVSIAEQLSARQKPGKSFMGLWVGRVALLEDCLGFLDFCFVGQQVLVILPPHFQSVR